MNHLYALLVGIDEYLVPRPLKGCVADIREYEKFLRGRIDQRAFDLHVRILIDGEATRAAVLGGLREHLGQAGPAGAALLVFCGHGSQQPSAHARIEPELKDETLVCFDSRIGGSDLADKEIGRCLREISGKGAHVVVILDCCHSGSGTRNLDGTGDSGRSAPPRFDPGPAGYAPVLEGGVKARSGWTLPAGSRHVLLAACSSRETAAEVLVGGRMRGAFSASLLQALNSCPATISYSSLFESAATGVRARGLAQNPQLEAIDALELDLPFLGGAVATRPRLLSVRRDCGGRWMLNMGAIHGLRPPRDPVRLILFPRGTPAGEMGSDSQAVGSAAITEVFSSTSAVTLDFNPEPELTGFDAFLEWDPSRALMVLLAGRPEGTRDLRRAIGVGGPGGRRSPYVTEGPPGSPLLAVASDEGFEIFLDGHPSPVTSVNYAWPDAAVAAVARLEHIACWRQVREWRGSENCAIANEDLEIALLHGKQVIDQRNVRLEYYECDGQLRKPGFAVRVRNLGATNLWFALLALTESFGIVPLLEEQSVALAPGQALFARGGQTLYTSLPTWLLERGATETVDMLRVLISESPFDGRLFRQPPLSDAGARSAATRLEPPFAGSANAVDWKVIDIPVRTIRAHPWQPLGPHELQLPAGVRLSAPPQFEARVRLNSAAPALQAASSAGRPYRFLEPCFHDPGLETLELQTIAGSVWPEGPLRIALPRPPDDGRRILAFTVDGGSLLPLGTSRSDGAGTSILIERLPEASEDIVRVAFRVLPEG
jgi:hypothetical protein